MNSAYEIEQKEEDGGEREIEKDREKKRLRVALPRSEVSRARGTLGRHVRTDRVPRQCVVCHDSALCMPALA